MRTGLRYCVRHLPAARLIKLTLFERGHVHRMLDEHVAGGSDHDDRLWLLINLEVWYRMLPEGMGASAMQREIERLTGIGAAAKA
jgi:asparagine synthase (glutamine-hydrolysing)